MSVMFEVYYPAPLNEARETVIKEEVSLFDGLLTHHEGGRKLDDSICLTFEFAHRSKAEEARNLLLGRGEHVENIQDY